jgi:hypothetical protein
MCTDYKVPCYAIFPIFTLCPFAITFLVLRHKVHKKRMPGFQTPATQEPKKDTGTCSASTISKTFTDTSYVNSPTAVNRQQL